MLLFEVDGKEYKLQEIPEVKEYINKIDNEKNTIIEDIENLKEESNEINQQIADLELEIFHLKKEKTLLEKQIKRNKNTVKKIERTIRHTMNGKMVTMEVDMKEVLMVKRLDPIHGRFYYETWK